MNAWARLIASARRQTRPRELMVATLAQWAVESGRGSSALARDHYNFAGLKYRARMRDWAEPVDYRGSDGDLATYCGFVSEEAFIAGYWHFIESGPYGGWEAFEDDGPGFIRHIWRSGYAADPDYVGKVNALIGEARALLLGAPLVPEPVDEADEGASPQILARLAVIVGHNAKARGAYAGEPIAKHEFDLNGAVARRIRDYAAQFNLAVEIFNRLPGTSYKAEVSEAYGRVAAWSPDVALELHFNASDNAAATGSETLYRPDRPASKRLAGHVQREILALLKLRDRGLKAVSLSDRGAGSIYALDPTPIVLAEPFFGSCASDTQRVAEVGQDALALAYLRAVRDFVQPGALAPHGVVARQPDELEVDA